VRPPRSRPGTRLLAAALAGAAGFAALAVLVAAGALTTPDRYAVHHLMPWWRRSHAVPLVDVRAVFVPDTRGSVAATAAGLWTYPASPFVSALVVAACGYLLLRRRRPRAALGLGLLWVTANLLELLVKVAVTRPSLGVATFDHSYPSGHMLRACVDVAAVASAWPRARFVAAGWLLPVPFALVALGYHTPSDVVGALFLAVSLLAVWARGEAVERRGARVASGALEPRSGGELLEPRARSVRAPAAGAPSGRRPR
jgi:membrane-associated phospholipid phosphatase